MKSKLVLLSSSLVLMALMFTAQLGQSQSTPDVTPAATVEVASEMGAVPTDCGILAESMEIDPLIPYAVGTWPIWIGLPNDDSEAKGILSVPNEHRFTTPQLEGWWTHKVAWFVPKSYTGEVHVRGFNVADDSPMYFEFSGNEPTDSATLDPAEPGGFAPNLVRFAFFPSHVWVSKAGCYRLEAEWDGGLWQQIIAVGSVE